MTVKELKVALAKVADDVEVDFKLIDLDMVEDGEAEESEFYADIEVLGAKLKEGKFLIKGGYHSNEG